MRNFYCFALLILQHGKNMLLCTLDGVAWALQLDIGPSRALFRDVQGDIKLRFNTASRLASAADQQPMLYRRNVDSDCHLVFAFPYESFDSSNDIVNDLAISFQLNSGFTAIGPGESDNA